MNPKLIGTWWLVRNNAENNKHLCVVKADSVEREKNTGGWRSLGTISGWLDLNNEYDRFIANEFNDITSKDFLELDLPEVTYDNPIEIEIMPSGNVYFY